MADYKYIGMTTYIKENEANNERLNVLAEAIESLQNEIQTTHCDIKGYEHIVGSDDFEFLYDNDGVCYPEDCELPKNTPEAYKRVTVENVNVKGIPMLRLYVPAVAKREDKITHFIHNALRPVLLSLFHTDVVSMKTKTQIEYKEFEHGEEHTLVSVKEKLKATV